MGFACACVWKLWIVEYTHAPLGCRSTIQTSPQSCACDAAPLATNRAGHLGIFKRQPHLFSTHHVNKVQMAAPVWTEIRSNGLTAQLDAKLKEVRAKRGFNPKEWVQQKAAMLNTYMRDCNLKACTVSVSGGVDSAVMYSPPPAAPLISPAVAHAQPGTAL